MSIELLKTIIVVDLVKLLIFLTLDEPMVSKLCFKSLCRGVGSMDYIYRLLITEDDLDDGNENDSTSNSAASFIATE